MSRRDATLLHRGRGQRRPANHVARGVDVFHSRPVARVDLDSPALVGSEPGLVEVELLGLPLASGGVEDDVGGDALAAGQVGQGGPVVAVDRRHLLAETKDDVQVPQVVLETLRDLGVAEVEEARPFLHHGDFRSQRGEHGRVLDADYPGPDDEDGGRNAVEAHQTVRVEDRAVVELDCPRARRTGAGGYHDPLGGQALLTIRYGDRVRVDEAGGAFHDADVVPHELVAHDVDLAAHHLLRPLTEILDRDLLFHAIARSIGRFLTQSGQVDDRFPQRFDGIVPQLTETPPS
jgi:hypothetical protein